MLLIRLFNWFREIYWGTSWPNESVIMTEALDKNWPRWNLQVLERISGILPKSWKEFFQKFSLESGKYHDIHNQKKRICSCFCGCITLDATRSRIERVLVAGNVRRVLRSSVEGTLIYWHGATEYCSGYYLKIRILMVYPLQNQEL